MTNRRLLATAAALVASALTLSACGGSAGSATPTSAPASGTSTSSNQAAADQVKALLAGNVQFPLPTAPVTPGTHKVAIIATGLASPGPATLARNAADAVKAIGWTADAPGDGKFTPTMQSQLIQQAVLNKVDGIILVAITPAAVDSAVQAAKSANIPIVCALCGPGLPAGMVGVANDDLAAGDAQAAYAASTAKSGDTVVVYQNTEFLQSKAQMAEAAKKVKEYCADCKVDTPSMLLTEASAPNAPIFTSLLNQYPKGKVQSVLMPFDTPAGVLSNVAQSLGRTDFGVVGLGSLAPFVDMVGTGQPAVAKADVLISTPLYGWASVDQLARTLSGTATWASDKMPVGLVDKSTYGNYAKGEMFLLPKTDWKATFTKLWGK